MHHHYILVEDPQAPAVAEFIDQHQLKYEVHLNRIRFWIPSGELYTLCMLLFGDHAPPVELPYEQ
jgi:hypothetical protein